MRKIELNVVALNGADNVTQVEHTIDMRETVYNLKFIDRWVKFLKEFEDIDDPEGIEPTNSPHDYDAWDFYTEEFAQAELDYISNVYMPRGDEDYGCGEVIRIAVLDEGSEKVLYEKEFE